MQYIEAVSDEKPKFKSIFLAGGISGCRDWQKDLVAAIAQADLDVSVINPRRENFPIDDPDAAEEQITWEYERLRDADMVSFWFDDGTLCPITLFEYGGALERALTADDKGGVVVAGVAPKYERKQDVEIQTRLINDNVDVVIGFDKFVKAVLDMIRNNL